MGEDSCAITITPKLFGKFLNGGVALWIVLQAWRFFRGRAEHGRAGAHERFDFFEQRGCHGSLRRQNQNAIARAAGENDLAILHFGAFQQRFRRAAVEIIAAVIRRITRRGRRRRTENIGCAFARQKADVGHRHAALQEELAAREVFMIGGNHVPPRLRAVPMNAVSAHRHARPAVGHGWA